MPIFCPECHATLPIVNEGETKICPLCDFHVPLDYDQVQTALREREYEQSCQAAIAESDRQDAAITAMAEARLQPRLLELAKKYRFQFSTETCANPTRAQLKDLSRCLFPDDARSVMEILDQYGVEDIEPARERIQFDVLKLAKGDLTKLKQYVAEAKSDFRDVAYPAELCWQDLGLSEWMKMSEAQQNELAIQHVTEWLKWLDQVHSKR